MSRWGSSSAALALLAVTAQAQSHLPDKRTTASGYVVTLYSVTVPPPGSAGGTVSADVEVCASSNGFAFPSYFQLAFADRSAIGGGAVAIRGKPSLERTPLQPKQCARGWMHFIVTPGQVPVAIHYHEPSADNKPIDWPLK